MKRGSPARLVVVPFRIVSWRGSGEVDCECRVGRLARFAFQPFVQLLVERHKVTVFTSKVYAVAIMRHPSVATPHFDQLSISALDHISQPPRRPKCARTQGIARLAA